MASDFSPYFQKYEQLMAEADKLFASIQVQHPDCVTCRQGCSDCCFALFDLSLVEALYLNHYFHQSLPQDRKEQILAKADQADRLAYKLKYQAYKKHRDGTPTTTVLEDMARQRVRCPLLNERDECDLYDHRPLTCRLYGVPQVIEGQARTCSLSEFQPGVAYPTVQLDKIQRRLAELSTELVAGLNTKYTQMADVLVPPSMALLTVYDDEYLGIQNSGCESSCATGCAPGSAPGSISGGCDSSGCASGGCGCQS